MHYARCHDHGKIDDCIEFLVILVMNWLDCADSNGRKHESSAVEPHEPTEESSRIDPVPEKGEPAAFDRD
jgi:hypothetical protein